MPRSSRAAAVALAAALACSSADAPLTPIESESPAVSLEIAPTAATVVRGLPGRFTATASFADGTTRDVTASAAWDIAPLGLARVEAGAARSPAAGVYEVRVSLDGLADAAPLTVLGTRVAFATSEAGSGDLSTWSGSGSASGTVGADAVCAAAAAAAGLPGAFMAWLSDSQDDAYCRLHGQRGRMADRCGLATLPASAGPWVRTDGWPFADGAGALLAGRIVVPLAVDERGRPLPAERVAWTGTGFDGAVDPVHPVPCKDWSVEGYEEGLAGHTRATTVRWSLAQWQSCLAASSLLCFEVGDGGDALPELAPVPALGAFTTSVFGTGNLGSWADAGAAEGIEAGDAICRARARAAGLASAASFKAWLAAAGVDPGARFQAQGPWARIDGVPLAVSRAALERGELFTALAVDEFGRPLDRGVWTGSDAAGRATADTCNDWRGELQTDLGAAGSAPHATTMWTRYFDPNPCLARFALYCLEDSPAP